MARIVRRRRIGRKGKKRVAGRRMRRVGKARVSRKSDYARLVEGTESYLTVDASGSLGAVFTTSLSDFQRAQEVAHAYKYYRCAKIELQFIPYSNQAVVGNVLGGPGRLPQLYFTVDRVANMFIQPNEAEMIERGVTPRVFLKKRVYSWKPNLLQNVQLETAQPADGNGQPQGINLINAINSVPLFNKWLPTQQSFGFKTNTAYGEPQTGQEMAQPAVNPYALRYYGASYCIDQEGGAGAQLGDLITKVTWEFKGPRALATLAPSKQTIISPTTSSITPGNVPNTQPTTYGT